MTNKFDIIIIGNGIISNSICYSLLKEDPTIKIAIIGDINRSSGATIAAGAMLNCFAEITSLSLKTPAGKAKFDIGVQALGMWSGWIDSINDDIQQDKIEQSTNGTYIIHNTKSGKLDSIHYNEIIRVLEAYNEPYERVDPTKISGFNPVDDARATDAIFLPKEGSINPRKVLKGFEEIFLKANNISIVDDAVISVAGKENNFTVETKLGNKFHGSKVILAAGASCQALIDKLPDLAKNIPRILAGVGYSLIMENNPNNPISDVIRTPNRSGSCGLHALANNKNNIYIGATNNVFMNPETSPSAGLIHFLLECALEQVDQDLYKSRILDFQVGNRPASLDTYPLIGETSMKGLWLVSGTYRDGFHMSPLLGMHIAKQIVGKPGLISHNIFAPERKLIQTLSKEESIDEGLEHYMSGAYERGMKLPKAGWDPMFRELIRKRLDELYQELESDFGLTPDMLMMFEFSSNRKELINRFKQYLLR